MKFLGVIALLLTATNALACDLTLVAPAKSVLKKPVQAKVSLAGDVLTASFSVSAPSLNAKKTLGPKEYPYMFDVAELFVTVSPLLAGRDGRPRLGLVEGAELLPGADEPAELLSVRRSDAHLFLRYRLR